MNRIHSIVWIAAQGRLVVAHEKAAARGKAATKRKVGRLSIVAAFYCRVGGLDTSTQNLDVVDFMAGNYQFVGSSGNAIINLGNIQAANGGGPDTWKLSGAVDVKGEMALAYTSGLGITTAGDSVRFHGLLN